MASGSSFRSLGEFPSGNLFAGLLSIDENSGLEPLDLFSEPADSSWSSRSSIIPDESPTASTHLVGQSRRRSSRRPRRPTRQRASDPHNHVSSSTDPYHIPERASGSSRRRQGARDPLQSPLQPIASSSRQTLSPLQQLDIPLRFPITGGHGTTQTSRSTYYGFSGPPPIQNSDESDFEILEDPFDYIPEHHLVTINLIKQALTHDPPPLYCTPPGTPEDACKSFARICAMIEEKERENPPDPTALHMMLHPQGEIPSCTYVDLNCAQFKIHINPTLDYDDRDLMVPCVADRPTVMKVVVDWPFKPVDSLPTSQMPDVHHYDIGFGDEVVSVEDVFNAVYRFMRSSVNRQQYFEYEVQDRRLITQAYYRRCRDWPHNPIAGGLLFVDLLGGKTQFTGLVRKETVNGVIWEAQFVG